MKKLLLVLVALLPVFAKAQVNWPDCNTMVVNNVVLTNDSIKVTIFNYCAFCEAGINGPVYCEMRVVRTVAPYDTLGRSNCYCFWTPDNQTAQTYTIAAETQALPAFSDMQVVLYCGSGTCEVIPFAVNVGIDEVEPTPVAVYPNPATNFITIGGNTTDRPVLIIDAAGRQVLHTRLVNGRVDISALQPGAYFVQFAKCYQYYSVARFVKQ